jgi:hypothetical protein
MEVSTQHLKNLDDPVSSLRAAALMTRRAKRRKVSEGNDNTSWSKSPRVGFPNTEVTPQDQNTDGDKEEGEISDEEPQSSTDSAKKLSSIIFDSGSGENSIFRLIMRSQSILAVVTPPTLSSEMHSSGWKSDTRARPNLNSMCHHTYGLSDF